MPVPLARCAFLRSSCGTSTVILRAVSIAVNVLSAGSNPPLSARAVGAALTSLGLTRRTRTNKGGKAWIAPPQQRKIHALVAAYGIDNHACVPPADATKRCDLCKCLEGKSRVEPRERDSES